LENPFTIRPTRALIDTSALEGNFRLLAGLVRPHAELIAVLKANAYGHGVELCAPALVRAGAQWLAVATAEEAVAAREVAPGARVLILGGVFEGQAEAAVELGLTPVVWERWQVELLDTAARNRGVEVAVHIEIDTGMSRQGVGVDGLTDLIGELKGSALRVEGVMTHLYAADEADGEETRKQLEVLVSALKVIAAAGLKPEILHVGSSAAILAEMAPVVAEIAGRFGMRTAMRPGLSLYGVLPEFAPEFKKEPGALVSGREKLKPVLSWKTRVATVRRVEAGAVVGYNGTFVATEAMTLALLPVGYADGLTRSLGNHFSLLVRGERAPIVGRVSMDLTVIDVTDVAGVKVGDEVTIIGRDGEDEITADDHARAAGTVSWEILTRISERVPRTTCGGADAFGLFHDASITNLRG
jgi:alanine racemase